MQLLSNNHNYYSNNIKSNNSINFKGYTIKPSPIVINHGYNPSMTDLDIAGYTVPANATPNYSGAYPNKDTKIYKAAPFEIIPEEIYKTHDYTLRDDLRLSQIKENYNKGYQNFAKNAYDEQQFLDSNRRKINDKIEHNKYYIDEYNKRLEYAKNDVTKGKLNKKIDSIKVELSNNQQQAEIYTKTLENANERFNLLKKVDDLVGKRSSLYYSKADISEKIMQINHSPKADSKIIQDGFAQGHVAKNKYKNYIKESNLKINKAIEKGVSPSELKKLYENELAYKQRLKQSYSDYRKEILLPVKEARKSIYKHEILLPQLEEKIKQITKQISQMDIDLDKLMAKIEKLYKAKYPNWL